MPGEVLVGYKEKILPGKSCQTLAHTAQGVVESQPLEAFKDHGDVALSDTVSGHGGMGLSCTRGS